jgi:hypothetical protein
MEVTVGRSIKFLLNIYIYYNVLLHEKISTQGRNSQRDLSGRRVRQKQKSALLRHLSPRRAPDTSDDSHAQTHA